MKPHPHRQLRAFTIGGRCGRWAPAPPPRAEQTERSGSVVHRSLHAHVMSEDLDAAPHGASGEAPLLSQPVRLTLLALVVLGAFEVGHLIAEALIGPWLAQALSRHPNARRGGRVGSSADRGRGPSDSARRWAGCAHHHAPCERRQPTLTGGLVCHLIAAVPDVRLGWRSATRFAARRARHGGARSVPEATRFARRQSRAAVLRVSLQRETRNANAAASGVPHSRTIVSNGLTSAPDTQSTPRTAKAMIPTPTVTAAARLGRRMSHPRTMPIGKMRRATWSPSTVRWCAEHSSVGGEVADHHTWFLPTRLPSDPQHTDSSWLAGHPLS
jgi:hypothetical protein